LVLNIKIIVFFIIRLLCLFYPEGERSIHHHREL